MYINQDRIQTCLYRKPTAGNTLLHAKRFHPPHTITSLPYGEFLRIRRAYSSEDLKIHQNAATLRFLERGYNLKKLETAKNKANKKDRQIILIQEPSAGTATGIEASKETSNVTSCRMITTYSKQAQVIKSIIKKQWPIIMTNASLKQILPDSPTFTFQKAYSMHNDVVRTSPELENKSNWLSPRKGFFKCSTCRACKFGVNTSHYTTAFATNKIELRSHFNCRTEYAVYLLQCTCRLRYIGSTKLPDYVRILQHLRAIVNSDPAYPVARHFKVEHANNLNCLQYYVIDSVPPNKRGGNREKQLRRLESKYIIELDTKYPNGLNTGEDMHNFL